MSFKRNLKRIQNKAFTLLELLVVIALISIISTITFFAYRSYQSHSNLEMSVQISREMLETAHDMSLSPPEKDGNSVTGYGVEFDQTTGYMKLFVDQDGNSLLDLTDKIIDQQKLLPKVEFEKFSIITDGIETQVANKTTILYNLPSSTPQKPYLKETLFNGCPKAGCEKTTQGIIIFKKENERSTLTINLATSLISVRKGV